MGRPLGVLFVDRLWKCVNEVRYVSYRLVIKGMLECNKFVNRILECSKCVCPRAGKNKGRQRKIFR